MRKCGLFYDDHSTFFKVQHAEKEPFSNSKIESQMQKQQQENRNGKLFKKKIQEKEEADEAESDDEFGHLMMMWNGEKCECDMAFNVILIILLIFCKWQ